MIDLREEVLVQPKRRARGALEDGTFRIVEHSGVDDVAGVPLASGVDAAVRDEAPHRVAVELTEDAEAALAEAERDGGGRVPDEEFDRSRFGESRRVCGVRVVEEEAAVVDAAGAGVRGHRRAHRPRLFG